MRGGSPGQRRRGGVPGIDEAAAGAGDLFSWRDPSRYYAAGWLRAPDSTNDHALMVGGPGMARKVFYLPAAFPRAGTITRVGTSSYNGQNYETAFGIWANRSDALKPDVSRAPLWWQFCDLEQSPGSSWPGPGALPTGCYARDASMGSAEFYYASPGPSLHVDADTLLWFSFVMNDQAAPPGCLMWPKGSNLWPILGLVTASTYANYGVGWSGTITLPNISEERNELDFPNTGSPPLPEVDPGLDMPTQRDLERDYADGTPSMIGQTLTALTTPTSGSGVLFVPCVLFQFQADA